MIVFLPTDDGVVFARARATGAYEGARAEAVDELRTYLATLPPGAHPLDVIACVNTGDGALAEVPIAGLALPPVEEEPAS